MYQENQVSLNALKRRREKINWEMEDERCAFFSQFHSLIVDWRGQLPNLRDIFRPDEIDWLLAESVKNDRRNPEQFVDFVINTGFKDEPDLSEDGKPILRRTTPIHRTTKCWFSNRDIVVGKLFRIYDSFDANYVDGDGSTHFHIACGYGFVDVVNEFLDLGQDPNCIVPKTGNSPLHVALENNKKEVAKLLSRHGANLILANKNRLTPLHIISRVDRDGSSTETFFEICSDRRQTLEIDARDNEGNSPLHLAAFHGSTRMVESLLRRGADPNSVNDEGKTPLHIMHVWAKKDVLKTFLDICDALNRPVQIDARDNWGNTPLHSAVKYGSHDKIELLLRRGADPNSANEAGQTPLHLICKDGRPEALQIFFKTCDEIQRTVPVDVRDNSGQTPLQLAVAAVSLDAVDILLDRGADLSEFSFPTESLFKYVCRSGYDCSKLLLASSVLRVVEHLEEKGCELNRNDVLTITSSFSKYGLFAKSTDLDESWYNDKNFVKKAKKIMIIKPDLTLYDLTRLRPEETKKLLAKKEYISFVCSQKLNGLLMRHRSPCILHLCEKISRGFFRRWAIDSFLELTGYKLPILCSEIIIKLLKNEDLCNICLSIGV